MMRACRVVAVALGLAVLGWQGVNAARGRFLHVFLVPDLIVAPALIAAGLIRRDRAAAPPLLAGFAAMAGVFLSATGGRLVAGGHDVGTGLTTIGLLPCLACGAWLGHQLAHGPVDDRRGVCDNR